MTEPNTPVEEAHHDIDAWRRILAAPTVLDVLAGHVEDWAPVPTRSAGWLTRTSLPAGWFTIPVAENSSVPLRVAVLAVDGQPGLAACHSLSAFRFTGAPAKAVLYENSDRALRAFAAEGVRTVPMILPERQGLGAVRSAGYLEVDGYRLWVRYSTFLSGSDEPLQGLVVEEIVVVRAELYLQMGKDVGALSGATKEAFTSHVGLSAPELNAAIAAHGERLRAEVNQGPALNDEQRRFLSTALGMWGGVASSHPSLTRLLGYADQREFDSAVKRLRDGLDHFTEPKFSTADWTRVLLLAEISFGSDVLGAGVEFEIVSAWRDPEALKLLRAIQRTLRRYVDASQLFRGDRSESTD